MTELTVAEALAETKRIAKLLPQRYAQINRYCSKRKESKDEVENQRKYVAEQRQSAEDLIKRYTTIKLTIAKSNLETSFDFKGKTYTIAEALLFKQQIEEMLKRLYVSFTTNTADTQINQYAQLKGYSAARMPEEDREKLDIVPELYYDPKEIQAKLEEILELHQYVDALIDKSNHSTLITI